MKSLIIANWKMNPLKGSEARKWFSSINKTAVTLQSVETVICPPLLYLESLGALVTKRSCVLGAQDTFWEHAGPYTGNISADMIFNTKARYVIVGHSERRALGETDAMIAKKIHSILQFPLIPVLCIGETMRDENLEYVQLLKSQVTQALELLNHEQISRLVIAYEPVWAIGANASGVCSPESFQEIKKIIQGIIADRTTRTIADKVSIIYGGSVDETNAKSFLQMDADGLLVGRASLDSKHFIRILKIAASL